MLMNHRRRQPITKTEVLGYSEVADEVESEMQSLLMRRWYLLMSYNSTVSGY